MMLVLREDAANEAAEAERLAGLMQLVARLLADEYIARMQAAADREHGGEDQ